MGGFHTFASWGRVFPFGLRSAQSPTPSPSPHTPTSPPHPHPHHQPHVILAVCWGGLTASPLEDVGDRSPRTRPCPIRSSAGRRCCALYRMRAEWWNERPGGLGGNERPGGWGGVTVRIWVGIQRRCNLDLESRTFLLLYQYEVHQYEVLELEFPSPDLPLLSRRACPFPPPP